MYTFDEHLDNLIRHINLVREACCLLGKRLIKLGRKDFGRLLIARGFVHDASKFYGIEWEYLHAGNDIKKDQLQLAIKQHVTTNAHHNEYWGGFEHMPDIAIAEMACDLYARSQEFGTNLREWITEHGVTQHKMDIDGEQYKLLTKYVDILLEDSFVRD